MSRTSQRVWRTVRLLSQEPVKIGIAAEVEGSPAESEREEGLPALSPDDVLLGALPEPQDEDVPRPPEPDRELLQQIEALQASLGEAEFRNAELTEAKGKLEAEIDGAKSDYEAKKRAIEADAASMAARAAEEARAKAHDEGWSAGHAEGLAAARAEVEKEHRDKFSALVTIIEDVTRRLEEAFVQLVSLEQPRMIRLWTEMLRRMLRRQVELSPDTVDHVLSDLLSRLSDKSQVVIYVCPEDAAHLEAGMESQFQDVLRGVHKLELKSDPNVDRGSCIVETGLGVYDARWRTQMEQVGSVVDGIFQQLAKDEKERAQEDDGPALGAPDEGETSPQGPDEEAVEA